MDATTTFDSKLESFRKYHLLEKHRIESFKDWPFSEKSACSITKASEPRTFLLAFKQFAHILCYLLCRWQRQDSTGPELNEKTIRPLVLFAARPSMAGSLRMIPGRST